MEIFGKQIFENDFKIENIEYKGTKNLENLAEYKVKYNKYTLQELLDSGYSIKEANAVLMGER